MIDVQKATMAELVAYYNEHADKPVKRFSDRAAAERRVAALDEVEIIIEDEYSEMFGTDHCPHCGVHLSNGVLCNGDLDGKGHRIVLQHEYECMGCGKEFGKEIRRSSDSSAAIAKSWHTPETAAKRSQRSAVKVNGHWFSSVAAAFRELNLPMNEHIKFRMELKAKEKLTAYGRHWEIVPMNYGDNSLDF